MVVLAEPPKANGFDFLLYGCPQCQAKLMYCECVATCMGGPEPVSDEDAAVILSGTCPDVRAFMKAWQEKTIRA